MAKINKIQSSFSTGEISPELYGRVELPKYQTALKTLHGFLVGSYGQVYKAPGSKYLGTIQDQTKVGRLIPFIYSNTDAYQIEFGNDKIRFWKNQGLILQSRDFSNSTFTGSTTGWNNTSSGTGTIDNNSNTLRLVGAGLGNEGRATADVLTRFGIGTYTVTTDVITAIITYKVGTTSAASDIATGTLAVGTGKTFTFTPTTNGNVYITFECAATSAIDNISISNTAYMIDSPYEEADLPNLSYTQSFDTLYLCNGTDKQYKLQRFDNDSWALSAVDFVEPPYLDTNISTVTMTPSVLTGNGTMTASSATFASTDVGRAIRYKAGPDSFKTIIYTGTGTQVYFDIPFSPYTSNDVSVNFIESTGARTAKTYTAGAPGAGQFTITGQQIQTGDTATTSQRVEVKQKNAGTGEWGWVLITAYTSTTVVSITVQRTLQGTNASIYWRLGAWSGTTGYPKTCTFHEQRLWFANTSTNPRGLWGSGIADFENFAPDNDEHKDQIDADTGVSFSLTTPAIQWIKGKKALLIGCVDGIVSLAGANGSISAIDLAPTKKDTSLQCAAIVPVETSDEVLFIEFLGKKIHSVGFSFENDGYTTDELTLLSDHFTLESAFTHVAYAEVPGKLLWAINADGELFACTYAKDQQMKGWAPRIIGGTNVVVESISVIPGSTYSELWMIVKRTINGSTKRYIECLQDKFVSDDASDAFFVDSGLIYEGAAVSTITGLDHLEGQTLKLNVEGGPHPTVVVSSGSITLQYTATKVIAGLGYTSELLTVEQDGGSLIGTSQSQKSRVREVGIRLHKTLGGYAAFSSDSTQVPILFNQTDDLLGNPPALFSGFKLVFVGASYNDYYQIYFKHDQPVPCTILNLIIKASVSDN